MSNTKQEEMSNDNNIKKQAEILLSQITSDYVKITLPIKKMFGIAIDVMLLIKNKSYAHIRIETSNCITYTGDGNNYYKELFNETLINTDEFELDDIIDLIKTLNETLKNLKFDKLIGKIVKLDNKKLDIDFWNCLIPKCDYIESVFENCCVCLEPTGTETKCCKQKLCIQCWDKLKQRYCNECNEYSDNCENECCGHEPCPCCRKSMRNQEKFNDELFD